MKIYINTSIEQLPDEHDLLSQIVLHGQDDQQSTYSWIGVYNARHELRLILESFSEPQYKNIVEVLNANALLAEVQDQCNPDDVFVSDAHLSRLFAIVH